jgi:hypothetical protein
MRAPLTQWTARRIACCQQYIEAAEDENVAGRRAAMAELIELHRHPPEETRP